MPYFRSFALSLCFCFSPLCFCQSEPAVPSPAQSLASSDSKPTVLPSWSEEVVTKKTLTIASEEIPYTACIGTLHLPDTLDHQQLDISYIAYRADSPKAVRPILFCFNGGPGSSSVWLHMGLLGPKKIDFSSPLSSTQTADLLNNPDSPLCVADLVFIDPISTGFSQHTPQFNTKEIFSVDGDVASFATFIERYLSKYNLWDAPKFLLGESYGTIRAVLLAKNLFEKHFIAVNGIMLISHALDCNLCCSNPTDELALISTFPTMVLATQLHLKSSPSDSLLPLYQKAKRFSTKELAPILLQNSLSETEVAEFSEKLAQLTLLPVTLLQKKKLRGTLDDINQCFHWNTGRFFGRFDIRTSGFFPYQDTCTQDPALSLLAPPFTEAINTYFLNDLKYTFKHPYIILNTHTNISWEWKNKHTQNYNFTSALQDTLSLIPGLRLYSAIGIYDAATPAFAQELVLSRISLDNSQERITTSLFEGGHMMYIDPSICSKLNQELKGFIIKNN